MIKLEMAVPKLTQQEALNSLKEEIYRVPFINSTYDRVFPVDTKIENGALIVEMSDGTIFGLEIIER